jgi:hypothetical protein
MEAADLFDFTVATSIAGVARGLFGYPEWRPGDHDTEKIGRWSSAWAEGQARTPVARSPSEKSCSLRRQTVGADLARSELTFE